jgi:hypothetical protein
MDLSCCSDESSTQGDHSYPNVVTVFTFLIPAFVDPCLRFCSFTECNLRQDPHPKRNRKYDQICYQLYANWTGFALDITSAKPKHRRGQIDAVHNKEDTHDWNRQIRRPNEYGHRQQNDLPGELPDRNRSRHHIRAK